MTEYGITDLPALIEGLPQRDRALAERILAVSATTGRLDPPEGMHAWIEKSFGSVDAVTEQRIVKVTNRVTLEGTLFNGLRASRPLDTGVSLDLDREIAATEGDPFCRPEEGTPADVFGRVRGEHATTASNIAKYDGFHGVVVFDDHNPLHLTPEKVSDYVSVGLEWCRKALEADPEAKYPFLMWNCLWRAGGSIIHGHAQVTATRDAHYPKVERLRRAAAGYRSEHGADYFGDLYRVHDALGLGVPAERGVAGVREPHPGQGEGARRDRGRPARPRPAPDGRGPAPGLRPRPRGQGLQRRLLHATPRPHRRGLVRLPHGRPHRGQGGSRQPHLGHRCHGAVRGPGGRLGPPPRGGSPAQRPDRIRAFRTRQPSTRRRSARFSRPPLLRAGRATACWGHRCQGSQGPAVGRPGPRHGETTGEVCAWRGAVPYDPPVFVRWPEARPTPRTPGMPPFTYPGASRGSSFACGRYGTGVSCAPDRRKDGLMREEVARLSRETVVGRFGCPGW